MILAMAVLETPSSRKWRISSSLPSSRETPSEPFGRPSLRPEALALARPSRVRSEIRSPLDLGEQREQRGHDLGLDVALALDADVLLQRYEGDAGLGERVEDGDDLTQRPAEPREFADDEAVAALEAVEQLVEPPSLLGSLPGGGRLDEVVDAEVVLARVLKDGEALAADVLLRGRDSQVGDGSHGLFTECDPGYFIGRLAGMECVMFRAAEVFGQNEHLCLTEPCRSPIPTSPAPA